MANVTSFLRELVLICSQDTQNSLSLMAQIFGEGINNLTSNENYTTTTLQDSILHLKSEVVYAMEGMREDIEAELLNQGLVRQYLNYASPSQHVFILCFFFNRN